MYQRTSPLDSLKDFFRKRSLLSNLIIINVSVFLLINLIKVFFYLFRIDPLISPLLPISKVVSWFAVPAYLPALVNRPWTIFTYMFLHENFLHLLFNMIMLYFGGRLFADYLGNRKLLSVYIWGGIAGAVLYIISYNIFPAFEESFRFSLALGASASVLAIIVAIATYVPNLSVMLFIFGKIKLKWIAIALVVLDLLSIDKGNPGGHLAHLGGAFWGFIYIKGIQQGIKFASPFSNIKIKNPFKKSRLKVKYNNFSGKKVSDEEYNYTKAQQQKRMDEILDKIAKSGYSSLTKEEKEFLFKQSNKN